MKRTLIAVLFASSLAAGSAVAGEDEMETARHFLDSGLYAEATFYLRAAADTGDAQAAEILGFLHSYGGEIFPGVPRDPVAAAQWFDLAARGGRPVGRYMSCALANASGAQATRRCLDVVAGQ
jgi:TPR repeat protein